jgi:type II secretory pathway pseudopilin PulG
MGQTQILMIILAVIIIGIAVTVGITQFGESSVAANRDALAGDCQRAVASAQQWRKKPTSLGGGNNSFTGATLAKLGIGASNQNGSYTLTPSDDGTAVTCVGTSASEKNSAGAALAVTVVYDADDNSTTTTDNLEAEEE